LLKKKTVNFGPTWYSAKCWFGKSSRNRTVGIPLQRNSEREVIDEIKTRYLDSHKEDPNGKEVES
jgi:hypothetical protein